MHRGSRSLARRHVLCNAPGKTVTFGFKQLLILIATDSYQISRKAVISNMLLWLHGIGIKQARHNVSQLNATKHIIRARQRHDIYIHLAIAMLHVTQSQPRDVVSSPLGGQALVALCSLLCKSSVELRQWGPSGPRMSSEEVFIAAWCIKENQRWQQFSQWNVLSESLCPQKTRYKYGPADGNGLIKHIHTVHTVCIWSLYYQTVAKRTM